MGEGFGGRSWVEICPTCGSPKRLKVSVLEGRQRQIWFYLAKYILIHRRAPTLQELAKVLRIKSLSVVHRHIKGLIQKGYIKKSSPKCFEILIWPPGIEEVSQSGREVVGK